MNNISLYMFYVKYVGYTDFSDVKTQYILCGCTNSIDAFVCITAYQGIYCKNLIVSSRTTATHSHYPI